MKNRLTFLLVWMAVALLLIGTATYLREQLASAEKSEPPGSAPARD